MKRLFIIVLSFLVYSGSVRADLGSSTDISFRLFNLWRTMMSSKITEDKKHKAIEEFFDHFEARCAADCRIPLEMLKKFDRALLLSHKISVRASRLENYMGDYMSIPGTSFVFRINKRLQKSRILHYGRKLWGFPPGGDSGPKKKPLYALPYEMFNAIDYVGKNVDYELVKPLIDKGVEFLSEEERELQASKAKRFVAALRAVIGINQRALVAAYSGTQEDRGRAYAHLLNDLKQAMSEVKSATEFTSTLTAALEANVTPLRDNLISHQHYESVVQFVFNQSYYVQRLAQILGNNFLLFPNRPPDLIHQLQDHFPSMEDRVQVDILRKQLAEVQITDFFLGREQWVSPLAVYREVELPQISPHQTFTVKILKEGVNKNFDRSKEQVIAAFESWRQFQPNRNKVIALFSLETQSIIDHMKTEMNFNEITQSTVNILNANQAQSNHKDQQDRERLQFFEGLPEGVSISRIYPNYSRKKLVVMDKIDGDSLDQFFFEQSDREMTKRVVGRSIALFFYMLKKGKFIANLQPGNLRVSPSGQITIVNWTELVSSKESLRWLQKAFFAVARADAQKLALAYKNLSADPDSFDMEQFRHRAEKVFKNQNYSGQGVFSLAKSFRQAKAEVENAQEMTPIKLALIWYKIHVLAASKSHFQTRQEIVPLFFAMSPLASSIFHAVNGHKISSLELFKIVIREAHNIFLKPTVIDFANKLSGVARGSYQEIGKLVSKPFQKQKNLTCSQLFR